MSRTRLAAASAAVLLAISIVAPVGATEPQLADLLIPGGPITAEVDPALAAASGQVQIVVRLVDPPLAVASGADAKQKGSKLNASQQKSYVRGLASKQGSVMTQIQALGGTELGRVTKALNAVIVQVDASEVDAIASLSGVRSVRQLGTYELDLSETVPYIGAPALWTGGVDGTGVRVAVLDSGIDYTHFNLGGSGTAAAYEAAYGISPADPTNTTLDGLFPTSKVVGGYDFVGESWPSGPRTEDPDPIDFQGHGTHVADIIAGKSVGGAHKGVAPGASLYAVKVCSAVATSCNGVALLMAMDFALDPNGDNSLADAVDVVNMSLGSSYGQREDDLSEASANAVRFGVTVVVSAGNSADRPYILGSPSSTPEVISVAQTQVPSAIAFPLVVNSPAAIAGSYANTATVEWAPIVSGFTGDVVNAGLACAPLPAGSLAGKVALIARGTCAVSLKADAATKAGAIGVVVSNNAPGDAPSFSFGGGDLPLAQTLIVTQATGNLIRSQLTAGVTVNVTVSPASGISLVGAVVASSSRGPSVSYNAIKPDIGAPGASISAIAGTGMGEEAFGGTSGAAPMVSGAAALLIQKWPTRTPAEIKSILMNTASTEVFANPATQPGVLAPITRIGGGEVRVDRAADATTAAWDAAALTGSLSFGYQAISANQAFKRTVRVRNYASSARTYTISPSFRYADDAASGAVEIKAPASIKVPANSSATFDVQLKLKAALLPTWVLNGGSQGGNGALLNQHEFDGYIDLTSGSDTVHVAWQILPHKAAAVTPSATSVTLVDGAGSVTLSNAGARDGRVDVFALTGTSPKIQKAYLPDPGDNFAVIDLKSVGVRAVEGYLQIAVNTFGERAHPNYPAEFDVYIDTDLDGTDDFVVYNSETGGFGATGQNVINVVNLAGGGGAYFYADADLNSANMIMTAPLSALGITAGTQIRFSVYAFDNYFTGALTDAIEGMTVTPNAPRYAAPAPATVPVGGSTTLNITAPAGGASASPSQSGLLLLYRDGRPQSEASAITVTP